MHEMTLFFSWCGILLKLFIAFIVGFMEKDNIQSSLFSYLKIKSQKPDEFIPYESE